MLLLSFYKGGFGIKQLAKVEKPLNKDTKLNKNRLVRNWTIDNKIISAVWKKLSLLNRVLQITIIFSMLIQERYAHEFWFDD